MKMTEEAVSALLAGAPVAYLSTVDADGAPYTVPVHFACAGGKVYIHGKAAGRKLDNLARDPRVCLTVSEMQGLLLADKPDPCRTNTAFCSVVIRGEAAVLTDLPRKLAALRAVADKYTPQLKSMPIPPAAAERTAVVEITIRDITGKYYK